MLDRASGILVGRCPGLDVDLLQGSELRLLSILFLLLAVAANKFEVVVFGVCLLDPKAFAMLPDIALLTSNTVFAVILQCSFR